MKKKFNTALFLIGATIVNIVIMTALFLVPLFLYIHFLAAFVPSSLSYLIFIAIPIGAIVGTYFIYNHLLKRFTSKVDMDKHFEPIFRKKKV